MSSYALADDKTSEELAAESISPLADTVVATIGDAEYSDLATAVSAAQDGDTITVVADIELSSTITVSGKSITITADDAYKISGASTLTTFISVSKGASLTLRGSLVIDGTNAKIATAVPASATTGAIVVKGSLTLDDDVRIQNFTIGDFCGVILVNGSDAVLHIAGGSICNNKLGDESQETFAYAGIVRVANEGTVNMTGGSITGNEEYILVDEEGNITYFDNSSFLYSSTGILTYLGGTVNISGGEISGNKAFSGSAINVYGYGVPTATVNISDDALITNNTCGDAYYWENEAGTLHYSAAGAVYIYCWGTINMSGGTISNNTGGMGGGVTVVSFWYNGEEYVEAANFNMTGGTISGNHAMYSGGGIYSYSTGVTITGGSIVDNTAENLGGGIYSEGNSYQGYGTVYLQNVIITENTAALEGGGLWLCPTGESNIYVTNGGAIYNNSATYDSTKDYYGGNEDETTALNGSAAGDDVVSGAETPHSLTLATRILGGGAVYYYTDGTVGSSTSLWPDEWKTADNPYWNTKTGTSTWPYPVVDDTVGRFGNTDDTEAKSVVNSSDYWALKSQAEGTGLAEALATVIISGNTARYGGGIGANGGVEIGEDAELTEVTVTKVWEGVEQADTPDSVTVYLTNTVDGTTYVIDSATLSADNNWTHTWSDLPVSDAYSYSVVEDELSGFTTSVSGDASSGFVITNTLGEEPDMPEEPDNPDTPEPDPEPETPDVPDTPEPDPEPETPDVPDTPEPEPEPETPDAPNTSDGSETPSLPQTGEHPFTSMWMVVGVLGSALSAIGVMVRKRV